jgi:hypothetical protein
VCAFKRSSSTLRRLTNHITQTSFRPRDGHTIHHIHFDQQVRIRRGASFVLSSLAEP